MATLLKAFFGRSPWLHGQQPSSNDSIVALEAQRKGCHKVEQEQNFNRFWCLNMNDVVVLKRFEVSLPFHVKFFLDLKEDLSIDGRKILEEIFQ